MSETPAPIPADRLHFATPPVHATADEERTYRKQRLAGALRLFGRFGYEDGVSGHLTARDPEYDDCYWVNPFAVPFSEMTASDLLLVDGDGRVRYGAHRVNQAAFGVHAAVHRARPEVVSVAHAHTFHGRALSALGELIEPITQESCDFYRDHALFDAFTGAAVDEDEGPAIAAALGPYKALVLRNHGLLTVGGSVDAAAWWFIQMERACGIQLAARAAGKPVLIGHKDALASRAQTGNDLVAWFSYQPLWNRISRAEPELLS